MSSNVINPKVTIVIPLYVISSRFFADFQKLEKLNYGNIEVLVVCDKKIDLPKLNKIKCRLVLTNKKVSGPAEKRDLALKYAKGEFCAFIDDDAYPEPNWLKIAVKWFRNPDIVAVGGPGITPNEDTFWEKVSGYIIESYLCSGGIQDRFYIGDKKGFETKPKFVVDWPAYNLIVRTSALKSIGGYGSKFYGGEDTLLCLKLLKYGRIIYDPEVVVYHHRRSFPGGLIKQIGGVGLHRGYFFKTYPKTSRSPIYLLPTILTIGFIFGFILALSIPDNFLVPFVIILFCAYLLAFISIKKHKVKTLPAVIASGGIIMIHISYGLNFVKGLLTKNLEK